MVDTIDYVQLEASAKELVYAVPGNDKGGRLMIYGNENAPHVLFFCAGFPDSVHAFLPLASQLAAENDCLCGVACLPGYDIHHENWKPQGYTFEEIVSSLRQATKILKATSSNDKAKWVGVFHDWGCLVGSMLTNRLNQELPGFFSKIVYFDVLPFAPAGRKVPKEAGFSKRKLVSLSYTSLFGFCHALQRYLSHFLAAPTFIVGSILLNLFGLAPTLQNDAETFENHPPKYSLRKLIYMAYPYYYLYAGKQKITDVDFFLPESLETTPVLYLYGLKKNIHFHDPNHLEWLEKESSKEGSSSKVVALDQSGHWLYLQQPEICYEEAKKFVFDS